MPSALEVFEARTDLKKYGSNAIGVFAIQLRENPEDIHAAAVEFLTDMYDDKKCDIIYVDRDRGHAIVAQVYYTKKLKTTTDANKASDLNTAAVWVLGSSVDEIPEKVRSRAIELREAIRNGEIRLLEFWFVHNQSGSKNVQKELKKVSESAIALLDKYFKLGTNRPTVKALEVSKEVLDEWHQAQERAILVTERFELEDISGFIENGTNWTAFTTTIPAAWLYERFSTLQTKLFSANVRDYLGSRKEDSNVNNGIKESAEKSPGNFWVFNNGLTALVTDFNYDEKKRKLTIDGLSIVNGAQTTGALGSLAAPPAESARVMARFIRSPATELIEQIVRFNNSQNRLSPADFRSTDGVQTRLRKEFAARKNPLVYTGGRRGGSSDKITRQKSLPSDAVAQCLTAFHGNPLVAYNRKSEIWEDDKHYVQVFNEGTSAEHVVFVYSLYLALLELKTDLKDKVRQGLSLKNSEQSLHDFFDLRGSLFLVVYSIAESLETIVDAPITNKFKLRFSKSLELEAATKAWAQVIRACLALRTPLKKPLERGLKSTTDLSGPLEEFKGLIEATKDGNSSIYETFAGHTSS